MTKPAPIADPMLQGTYQQDDSHDFPDSSTALEDFERHLAAGTATHSPPKHTRAPQPKRTTGPSAAAGAKQAGHAQPPPMRPSFTAEAPRAGGASGARRMSEEQQAEQLERAEEVAEVRRLGHEDGDDSD